MAAKLKEEESGLEFLLGDFNLIGRGPYATIRIKDGSISRQHATIRREGNYFWIRDLGSANGTYVNDVAVNAARLLRSGDRVKCGISAFFFDQDDHEGLSLNSELQTQMMSQEILPLNTIEATLLVGDLVDFTTISSQLKTEEVGNLLREWYTECESILKPRGAVIDKFIGDGVFAYWTKVDEKTKTMAVEAAELMSCPEANHSVAYSRVTENLGIAVQCCIGLHIGEVSLGTMERGVNTIVGDAVNVAFRIERLTRKLGTPVLASKDFMRNWTAGLDLFENGGLYALKGHPDPVEVFRLKKAAERKANGVCQDFTEL
jgi:adenylate cyclase